MNHIVNFYTVHKLSIVPHFSSNPVELAIKFFEVWECPQVSGLDIISHLLIRTEVFNDLLTIFNFFGIVSWLLQPFFKKTTANLGFALIKKSKYTACLAGCTHGLRYGCSRKHI